MMAVAIFTATTFANAAEPPQPTMTPADDGAISLEVISAISPPPNATLMTSNYKLYDLTVTPHEWCLCALTVEEEIFLRQYEP